VIVPWSVPRSCWIKGSTGTTRETSIEKAAVAISTTAKVILWCGKRSSSTLVGRRRAIRTENSPVRERMIAENSPFCDLR